MKTTRTHRRRRSGTRLLALAVCLGVTAAACSSDDESSDNEAVVTTQATPSSTEPAGTGTTAAPDTTPVVEIKTGGTLNIAIDAGPRSLDHRGSRAIQEHTILDLMYESLLGIDGDLQPTVPVLATEWTVVSETVYEFTIREGVKFHDGSTMTVDDVVFTFERLLNPDFPSPPLTKLKMIAAVTAVDDTTVRFELNSPSATFLFHMASPETSGITSQAYVEPQNDDMSNTAMGTGPFKYVEYVPDSLVRMEKHTEYWQEGLPYLDELVFQVIPDDASRIAALRTGEASMSWFRPDKIPLIQQLDGVQTSPLEVRGGNQTVFFNCNKAPFDNVDARRAFLHAIDEEAIMNIIYPAGVAGPSRFNGPEAGLFAYTGDGSDLPYFGANIDDAKAALEAAGLGGGIDIELVYINTPTFEINRRISELIVEQVDDAGINVSLKGIDVTLAELAAGEYNVWATGLPMLADPDGQTLWLRDAHPPVNCSTPELEAILDAQAAETDLDARIELWSEIQDDLLEGDAMHYVLLAEPLRVEVWDDSLQGYSTVPYVRRTALLTSWIDE